MDEHAEIAGGRLQVFDLDETAWRLFGNRTVGEEQLPPLSLKPA
jgi:hypothetical protein